MKYIAALALVALNACSSGGLPAATPVRGAFATAMFSTTGATHLSIYGSPEAFKQTSGDGGIAYDGAGGLWISSHTAFEHRVGSSVSVINNGLGATSAWDTDHSIYYLLPLNGYVYGIGHNGADTLTMVRIGSDGSRSVLPVNGLGGAWNGFRGVASGANAIYALWPQYNSNSQEVDRLVRVSPYGVVENETPVPPLDQNSKYQAVTVSPKTGEAYVLQTDIGNQAARIDRYTADGTHLRTYDYTGQPLLSTSSMVVGPDGNLYIPDFDGDCVFVLNVTSGTHTSYPLPTKGAEPWNPVVGSDGNIWFVEYGAQKLAKMTPGGQLTEYAEPMPDPTLVTAGPNSVAFISDHDYFDSVIARF